jgi:hypothetical protein
VLTLKVFEGPAEAPSSPEDLGVTPVETLGGGMTMPHDASPSVTDNKCCTLSLRKEKPILKRFSSAPTRVVRVSSLIDVGSQNCWLVVVLRCIFEVKGGVRKEETERF